VKLTKNLINTLDLRSPIPVPENAAPKSREYWYDGCTDVLASAVLE
jgi:hypothetical protein